MPLKNIGEYTFAPGTLRLLRPKNTDGKNVRMTVNEVLAQTPLGMKALMAAPMFGHTGTGPCKPGGLTPCTRQFDSVTKVDLPSCRKKSGLTFSVTSFNSPPPGSFISVEPLDRVLPGASLGLQCYPTLVWDGINKGRKEKPSSVAGLGVVHGTGTFLCIVGSGGTLRDLGALFLERGCDYAGYTDAGSSAALYVVGEGWRGVHAKNPKLPCWLAVM